MATNAKEAKRKEVLILGGGFGGVAAAKTILKNKPRNISITLVDQNEFHSFPSDWYEVATAFLHEEFHKGSPKRSFHELRSSAAIRFQDLFKGQPITIVQGRVQDIDFKEQVVMLDHGKKLPYYYLVIALGSETNFFGIPHLSERALELKSLEDALNIRNAADELFETYGKQEKIKVVVAGGGFTGCELAGELMGYLRRLAHMHGHPTEGVTCSIVEAAPILLPGASAWVQEKAAKRFSILGIELHLDSLITNVHEHEVELKGGARLPYHLLIWTAGIRPNQITDDLVGVIEQQKSCLVIDRTFAVKPYKNVYAVGDIAYCTHEKTKERIPATAQLAISQGLHVGSNIIRKEAGYALLPYKAMPIRFLVPLGSKYALADLGWIKFSGWPAWLLKRLIALRYFIQILPLGKAVKHWRGGLEMYIQND